MGPLAQEDSLRLQSTAYSNSTSLLLCGTLTKTNLVRVDIGHVTEGSPD